MLAFSSRLQKELAQKNKPTTASTTQSCFRSVDREKFPGWASRYATGDIYDLDYNVCYENIKGKGNLLHRKRDNSIGRRIVDRTERMNNIKEWVMQRGGKQPMKVEQIAAESAQAIDPSKYKQVIADRIQQYSSQSTINKSKLLENLQSSDRHTIDFMIRSKSGHNIRFQKQPSRKENVLKVLYNMEMQLSSDPLKPNFKQRYQQIRSEKTVHLFPSYQQHSVFNPLPITDVTYNWTEPEAKLRPRCNTAVGYRLTTRKNSIKADANQPQPSTRLDYRPKIASHLTKLKIPGWKINDAEERKLVFSRQVISPKRGCSR